MIWLENLMNWQMKLTINDYSINLFCPPAYGKIELVDINDNGILTINTELGVEYYDIVEILKNEDRMVEWEPLKEAISNM